MLDPQQPLATYEEHPVGSPPVLSKCVRGEKLSCLLQQAARGARVRPRELAREVGLRLDQVLEALLLGHARDLKLELDRLIDRLL
jgi:hypothetical protein